MKNYIVKLTEPTTPLYNADHGGAFLFLPLSIYFKQLALREQIRFKVEDFFAFILN